MLKRTVFSVALVGLLFGVSVLPAEATPITGGFSIAGNFLPVDGVSGLLTALGAATGIDFSSPGGGLTPGAAGTFFVFSAAGDFLTLVGQTGSIRDFAFAAPGSGSYPNPNIVGPLIAFQNVGSTTFTLTSIGAPVLQNNSMLALSGQGYFTMAGYTDTYGTFSFTGNGANGTFSFSASNGSTNITVPEPASVALLGSGLILLSFGLRYRRNKSR